MACATLAVPVDHDRPVGPTVELALARRPAADTPRRLGTVVVNPGGPGASGVELLRAGSVGGAALARFDIVSWDPRGVGDSRPLDCDEPVPAYRVLDWTPDDDGERAALDAGARELAEGCRRAAGVLADHLATEDSARDLDLLREALGEERLTYVGFSYGTALGLHHLARFPGRVRALVLDGVADPREDLAAFLTGQANALEGQVTGALGDGGAQYDRVLHAAEEGRGPVDPTTVAYGAIAASYRADGGPALRAALADASHGNGRSLRALADGYWSAADYGAYAAVVCSDLSHPDGPRAYDRLVAEVAAEAPRFGAVIANELRPCAWWPPSAAVPTIAAGPRAPSVLVVGNTGDVATPYETAVRITDALGRAALVTYDGEGHTSMGRSDCVDGYVRAYLEALATPPAGARCS